MQRGGGGVGSGAEVAGDPGSLSSAHTSRTEQEVTGAFLPHLFAEGVLKKKKCCLHGYVGNDRKQCSTYARPGMALQVYSIKRQK